VKFSLLGPLEARLDGHLLALGGPKQRGLLAILLLHANEAVSRDRLIDGLWGDQAPPTAQRSLDTYVSRLRSLLGADRVERRAPGYLLRVEAGELDLDKFGALVERARSAASASDFQTAAGLLGDALALWRGPALADLLYEPFAGTEAARLEEQRLLALEERVEADLELGAGAGLVPELEALVREHPFRERLLAQLMLALYRAGRQSQALAAFQSVRQQLTEELGLEPGLELRELQRKILEHDAGLGAPRAGRTLTARRRRQLRGRQLGAAGAAAAVAASVAIGVTLGIGGTEASSTNADSSQLIGLRSTSGTSGPRVSLSGSPTAMAAGAGSLWIADPGAGTVLRVDPPSQAVVDRVVVG
jgi:DNA-binding SARP family transcriptional activator